MVLHKLMLEPYLKRRFNEGVAQGEERGRAEAERETDAKLQDWNNRRLDAEARGERFDEPLPVSLSRKTNPHHQINIASPKL